MGGCATKIQQFEEDSADHENMWGEGKSLPQHHYDALVNAFKKGIHWGEEKVHELQRTLDHGFVSQTVIPGVYTYNGLHDIALEIINTHLGGEIKVLLGANSAGKAFKKVQNKPRTKANWIQVQEAVSQAVGVENINFPEHLDSQQLVALMTHNPFFTAGMSVEKGGKMVFNATRNSMNPLTASVFKAFGEDYACSKLWFSQDLTNVTLEVQGETFTDADGDVFDKKLRVFITCLLYWFEMCHAALHVYIYVMLGSANKAANTTPLQGFVKQYQPNILIKYLEVKLLLLGKGTLLKGQYWGPVNQDQVDIAALDIFKAFAGARNAREWLRKIFLANLPELLEHEQIQVEAKKYAAMLPHLSDATMDSLRHQFTQNSDFVNTVSDVSDNLIDYLAMTDGKRDSENYFGMNTFQDWIECQGMAGILHGNTLGLTRLLFTDYSCPKGNWDTNTISDIFGQSSAAVGTLMGLEEQHAVNETEPLEETPFHEMMNYFHEQTKAMQTEFWDNLSDEDKDTYAWCKSVWGPNMIDATQLTITSYV